MKTDNSPEVLREFMLHVERLYELVCPEGDQRALSLSEVESLDLSPYLASQEALDREGVDLLSTLPMPDLLVLNHRIEVILKCLAPFLTEDGPLAQRISALTGHGPIGAYRRASQDSPALFGQNSLGQA